MTTPASGKPSAQEPPTLSGESLWPTGGTVTSHHGLARRLWDGGRFHARLVVASFASDDSHEQALAAISVGCAVELLSKARIAFTEPALLSERGDRDTLLHLTNHGSLASRPATDLRSISATEAVATA